MTYTFLKESQNGWAWVEKHQIGSLIWSYEGTTFYFFYESEIFPS